MLMNPRNLPLTGNPLRAWLLLSLMTFASYLSAAPFSRLVGPTDPRLDHYQVGRESLKLKAILLDSNSIRDIRDAVEQYRRTPGTSDWSARIGYVDIDQRKAQSLVLSWVNLDASEMGWTAVTLVNGQWQVMTSDNETWRPLVKKNSVYRGRTNGQDVFTRVSRVTSTRLAFAFSRVAFFFLD